MHIITIGYYIIIILNSQQSAMDVLIQGFQTFAIMCMRFIFFILVLLTLFGAVKIKMFQSSTLVLKVNSI